MVDVRQCQDVLIKDVLQRGTRYSSDARLAQFVTQQTYEEIKHSASGSATIYGVPMGANYDDYKKNVSKLSNDLKASLSVEEATNLLWVGLGDNATSAYKACLKASILSAGGLHLSVRDATDHVVTLEVTWNPQGIGAPIGVHVQWEGAIPATSVDHIPTYLHAGTDIVRVARPKERVPVVVRVPQGGHADSVVLTPLPPEPAPCRGLEDARGPFGYVPGDGETDFLVEVPECGHFWIEGTFRTLIFANPGQGPTGETDPTTQRFLVKHRLHVVRTHDMAGEGIRVEVDIGHADAGGGMNYVIRPPAAFSSVVPNWPIIRDKILNVNRKFASLRRS